MLQLMQNALIGGIYFFVTFCDDSIKKFNMENCTRILV